MKYLLGIIIGAVVIVGGWHMLAEKDMAGQKMAGEQLTIAVSFYPLAFAVEQIVGDHATVVNVGEGRDPHDVQLSTQDVLTMQEADLVVIQGAELEPWGDDMVDQLKDAGVPVHIATAELKLMESEGHDDHGEEGHDEKDHDEDEHEHEEDEHHDDHEDEHEEDHHDEHEGEHGHDEHGHAHGAFDPHTWLDPVLMGEMVGHLTEAIVALDGAYADEYEANAAALQTTLADLDTRYVDRLATCTFDEVITSHDAFGYLGERYGFAIHAIGGLSTQDVPSATVLAELREEAEEGINAILLEASSVTAYGETLARETGLATLPINPISFVVPAGEDYVSIMESNLDTFAEALSCNG